MKKCAECGYRYKKVKKIKNAKQMCPNCGCINTSNETIRKLIRFLWRD